MGNEDRSSDVEETVRLSPDGQAEEKLASGTVVGQYVVEEPIGSGGGGMVYRVRHTLSGHAAALKIIRGDLSDSPRMVRRFLREVQTLRMVAHPNVVQVLDLGTLLDGRPYYVMEHLEGITLRQHVITRGRLTVAEALQVLEPVCGALDAAHGVGVVHRDLKASNVFVAAGSGDARIKLLDFGIAKLLEPPPGQAGLTAAGSRVGTPQTMAPEQVLGEAISPATDVYALGVLLYFLLTGAYPFHGEDAREVEMLHLKATPPLASQSAPVPGAVDAVILRAMEKSPLNRFPSAGAFLVELQRAAQLAPKVDAGELARAVAVYLELSAADTTRALGDDELDHILDSLDAAERTLVEAGFAIPLQTSSSLLGVRVLSGDEVAARAAARALAEQIDRELAVKFAAEGRVRPRVVVHLDDAQVARGQGGPEVTGGPITQVESWDEDSTDKPGSATGRVAG